MLKLQFVQAFAALDLYLILALVEDLSTTVYYNHRDVI